MTARIGPIATFTYGERVTYKSLSGNVTAKVIGLRHAWRESVYVLRSTSRTNAAYPSGLEWRVRVDSPFLRRTAR